jgi:hypothetical protein
MPLLIHIDKMFSFNICDDVFSCYSVVKGVLETHPLGAIPSSTTKVNLCLYGRSRVTNERNTQYILAGLRRRREKRLTNATSSDER